MVRNAYSILIVLCVLLFTVIVINGRILIIPNIGHTYPTRKQTATRHAIKTRLIFEARLLFQDLHDNHIQTQTQEAPLLVPTSLLSIFILNVFSLYVHALTAHTGYILRAAAPGNNDQNFHLRRRGAI